ncbi:MAG: hypothetical protein N0E58_19390 [Candidatus Thiodiazotropha endolucinida]|uniref:Uncharacterized protein n=1 Tax=Candidatus Thiodiazotropha taylori TaxID=2792791 RepID=A0A9E4NN94_9GAMM|nr:hypothetical protein [Candidatus Thiodiazotropha taylori]MCW4238415.1 hypothetical protein [Candidatus Thiodiazotropha endolucinida]
MKKRKKKQSEHTFISIMVDEYSTNVYAGINPKLLGTPHYIQNEDDPAYKFETKLEIKGICTDPLDRSGHRFDITMYGTLDKQHLPPTIKELHERNKNGDYLYRKYRGRVYPVYETPPPIAFLEKIRGENHWVTWLWVSPQLVTDSLIVLSGNKQVFVSIHEIKEYRQRQIKSLSIQTVNPEEE